MAQSFQTGSTELSYNNATLPPPWQRGNTPLFANDPHTKKRKLEASRTNVSKRQTNPPVSQMTTDNRFGILEADNDMDSTAAVNIQLTQTPLPPPTFIDNVIDIQSMTKTIQKEIGKEEYKLKISNNSVAALIGKIHNGFRPVNPLHKKSCIQKDEFIIDLTTLGGYRRLIKIRRFCRDHMPSSRLPEKSKFVNKVESSASVGIFREHLQN